jgi:sugar lactone lactonase YvrE
MVLGKWSGLHKAEPRRRLPNVARQAVRPFRRRFPAITRLLLLASLLPGLLPPPAVFAQAVPPGSTQTAAPAPGPAPTPGASAAATDQPIVPPDVADLRQPLISMPTLLIFSGTVELRPDEDSPWQPAANGLPLRSGMSIRTAASGYAMVAFRDGTTLTLDPSTEITLAANSDEDDEERELMAAAADDTSETYDETEMDVLAVQAFMSGAYDPEDDNGDDLPDMEPAEADQEDDDQVLAALALMAGQVSPAQTAGQEAMPEGDLTLPAVLVQQAAEEPDDVATIDDLAADAAAYLDGTLADDDPSPLDSADLAGLLDDAAQDTGTAADAVTSLQVIITLKSGQVWAKVEGQADPRSAYVIEVPGGSIISQGATFSTRVAPDQSAQVHVVTGTATLTTPATPDDLTLTLAAGEQSWIWPDQTLSGIEEPGAPARALRIALNTPDVLYVCDRLGRCAGQLPVVGLPIAVQVNQIPGAFYTGPAAADQVSPPAGFEDDAGAQALSKAATGVQYLVIPDPLDAYNVVLQFNAANTLARLLNDPSTLDDQTEEHSDYVLEVAGLVANEVASADAITGSLVPGTRQELSFTVAPTASPVPAGGESLQIGPISRPEERDELQEALDGYLVGVVPGARTVSLADLAAAVQAAALVPASVGSQASAQGTATEAGASRSDTDLQPQVIRAAFLFAGKQAPPAAPSAAALDAPAGCCKWLKKAFNTVKNVATKVVKTAVAVVNPMPLVKSLANPKTFFTTVLDTVVNRGVLGIARVGFDAIKGVQQITGVRILPKGVENVLNKVEQGIDKVTQTLGNAIGSVMPWPKAAKALEKLPDGPTAADLGPMAPVISAGIMAHSHASKRASTTTHLPPTKRGPMLARMPAASRANTLAHLPAKPRAQLLKQLPPKQQVKTLSMLPKKQQLNTIKNMPPKRQTLLQRAVELQTDQVREEIDKQAAAYLLEHTSAGRALQSRLPEEGKQAWSDIYRGARVASRLRDAHRAASGGTSNQAALARSRAGTRTMASRASARAIARPASERRAFTLQRQNAIRDLDQQHKTQVAEARTQLQRQNALSPAARQRLDAQKQAHTAKLAGLRSDPRLQNLGARQAQAITRRTSQLNGAPAIRVRPPFLLDMARTARQNAEQQRQALKKAAQPPRIAPSVAALQLAAFPFAAAAQAQQNGTLAAAAGSGGGGSGAGTNAPATGTGPGASPTSTPRPTQTATPSATVTPQPQTSSSSDTNEGPASPAAPTATPTLTPTPTSTATPTLTPTPTSTATPTPAGCSSSCLYWTQYTVNVIRRAPTSGSPMETLISTGLRNPFGVALDLMEGKMYIADGNTPAIKRANLDGSAVETLVSSGLGRPIGIAVDHNGGKVYWTDELNGTVKRANLDGSAVETLVSGLNSPQQVTLDLSAGKMYWASRSKIQRASLDGSSVQDLVATGITFGEGIALDGAGKVYWTDISGNTIKRANLDGSGVETLISSGLNRPAGLVISTSTGKMYWADSGTGKIIVANLDGTSVQDVITGISSPYGLALSS